MSVPEWLRLDDKTAFAYHREAREGRCAPFPAWADASVVAALERQGITCLWQHQRDAANAAHDGQHVALATGTASGKTVAYLLPIITATVGGNPGRTPAGTPPSHLASARSVRDRLGLPVRPTALYIAPTKALARDQLRVCESLGLPTFRPAAYDGDCSQDERAFARDYASFLVSNPDMLHRTLLPRHQAWSRFLASLTYVVIDEAHRYRGVFGAHVAAVLRRLRRICRSYGADPTFIVVSATMSDADSVARALTGVNQVTLVDTDASPAAALDVLLREPSAHVTQEAAQLLALMSGAGQTLAFTQSRHQAETIAVQAKRLVTQPETIAAYRGGYLAEDRRHLEHELQTGRLRGVACTNALELGVDISGVDTVLSVGFPGTLTAWWQQIGRAGRSGRDATALLLAREDPLDAYLVAHPELLFGQPVERTIIHPDNPYVLAPHLAAAAAELPLTEGDVEFFGPSTIEIAEKLTAQGVLRLRRAGWFWPHAQSAAAAIDLRSMQGKPCEVVDEATGVVIGLVDPSAADRTLYPGAIYLHQGDSWLVRTFDEETRVGTVVPIEPAYTTQPLSSSGVHVLHVEKIASLGLATVHYGTVELSRQVTAFLRRDAETGQVWDQTPLTLPTRSFTTQAMWWTLPADVISALAVDPHDLPGAVHAAEHAGIGLLPLFVPCDRWDIGGLSATLHPDTGQLTVFVHDGLPGGSGFAERGFAVADAWWRAVLDRLTSCTCSEGCPACVVSPKCGSGNTPLSKSGAAELVRVLALG